MPKPKRKSKPDLETLLIVELNRERKKWCIEYAGDNLFWESILRIIRLKFRAEKARKAK